MKFKQYIKSIFFSKKRVVTFILASFTAIFSILYVGNKIGIFSLSTGGAAPIAYWKFEEGQGSTAYDSMGSNNGTLGSGTSAPTWVTEDQCISGKCLRFDGTNDYVNTNYSSNDSSITVSVWIKPFGVGLGDLHSGLGIVNKYDVGFSAYGWKLAIDNNGAVDWVYYSPSCRSDYVNTSTSIIDKKWHFVEATRTSSGLYLYIDGVQVGSDTSVSCSTVNNSAPVTIGKWREGVSTNEFFKGYIDDVKIYNYARSASQIKADFSARGSTKGVSAQFGDASTGKKLSDGLVGYWKMDESTGSTGSAWTALDSSGNNNNGVGVSDAGPGVGKFGNGGSFDGSGDYVSTNVNSSIFNTSDEVTMNLWFKANVLESLDSMVQQSQNQSYLGFASGAGNTLRANIVIDSATAVVTGNTTLVTGT